MDNANIIIGGVGCVCVCVFAPRIVQNFIANGNVLISDSFFHSQYSSDTILKCSKALLGSDFLFMHHCGNTVAIENYDFLADLFGSHFTYLVCSARAWIQGFAHRRWVSASQVGPSLQSSSLNLGSDTQL